STLNVGLSSGRQRRRSYILVVEISAWPSHSCTLAISAPWAKAFVAAVALRECTQNPRTSAVIPTSLPYPFAMSSCKPPLGLESLPGPGRWRGRRVALCGGGAGYRSDELAAGVHSGRRTRSVYRREYRVRAASHTGRCAYRAPRVSRGVSWV